MKRRELLKGLLVAPLALLGWKPAKAERIVFDPQYENWNGLASYYNPNCYQESGPSAWKLGLKGLPYEWASPKLYK